MTVFIHLMGMFLAIDVGNSRTGAALFRGRKLVRVWHEPTFLLSTVASVKAFLNAAAKDAQTVEDVWIASVVPKKNSIVVKACRDVFGVSAHVLTTSDVPLKVKGYDLSGIGIDRLIGAFAAYSIAPGACIAIDAGSCITFDCVSEDGIYLGGAIAPGLSLSARAMHQFTAKIPKFDYRPAKRAIGRDTESSVMSGVHYGTAGLIDNVVEVMAAEMRCRPRITATGGDAVFVVSSVSRKVTRRPALLFEGMRAIREIKLKGES